MYVYFNYKYLLDDTAEVIAVEVDGGNGPVADHEGINTAGFINLYFNGCSPTPSFADV